MMKRTIKPSELNEDRVDKKLVAGLLSIVIVATFTSWAVLVKANDWAVTPDYQTGLATAGSDAGFLSSVLAGGIALFAVIGFGAVLGGEKRGVGAVTWASLLLLILTVAVPTAFVGLKYQNIKTQAVETKTLSALTGMLQNTPVVEIQKIGEDQTTKMVLNTQTCDYYIATNSPVSDEQIVMAGNNDGTFSLTKTNSFVYTEGNWSRQFWQDIPLYTTQTEDGSCANIAQIGTYLNDDGSINNTALAQEALAKDTTPPLLVFWQGSPQLNSLNLDSGYNNITNVAVNQTGSTTKNTVTAAPFTLDVNKGWSSTKYVFKPTKETKLLRILENLRLHGTLTDR